MLDSEFSHQENCYHPLEVSENHKYYLPEARSMTGFQISERSFHAVDPVLKGIRYSLIYSFKGK